MFSEGLCAVQMNGKWGFINTKGEMVIKPQFRYAYSFNNNLAHVTIKEDLTYAYIDTTGKEVIHLDIPGLSFAGTFNEGFAAKKGNDKYGGINKAGETPPARPPTAPTGKKEKNRYRHISVGVIYNP